MTEEYERRLAEVLDQKCAEAVEEWVLKFC